MTYRYLNEIIPILPQSECWLSFAVQNIINLLNFACNVLPGQYFHKIQIDLTFVINYFLRIGIPNDIKGFPYFA